MRAVLLAIATTLLICHAATAAGSIGKDAYDDLDSLAILYVANEKCTGQRYDAVAILEHMKRIGTELRWGQEKITAEIGALYQREVADYETDPEFYCEFTSAERRRKETELKALKIIN